MESPDSSVWFSPYLARYQPLLDISDLSGSGLVWLNTGLNWTYLFRSGLVFVGTGPYQIYLSRFGLVRQDTDL